MPTAAEQFIYDIDRLREIDGYPTVPNLISASGILRRLLLDGHPLIHQANRELRLPLHFTVADRGVDWMMDVLQQAGVAEHAMYVSTPHGLEPDGAPEQFVRDVRIEEFLALPVERSGGETLSVKDLILYVANVAGGVHYAPPKDTAHQAFHPVHQQVKLGGVPAGLQTVAGIMRIVLRATEELYGRLRA